VFEDVVVRLVTDRTFAELLGANGFTEDQAKQLSEQINGVIPETGTLLAGSIIALRNRPDANGPVLLQASIYGPDGYIGSAARRGTIGYVPSADPWIDVDLFALSAPTTSTAAPAQDFRLLDAVYSAAIRRGVPTTLVGEMIVMLSQAHDLDAFAAPGDELTVLYAPNATETGPGQILFAGINGPSGEMPCYVGADEEGYSCFSQQGRTGGAGPGGGFHTPVQGTLTSSFGPRFHPILKTHRLHGGVDWAAPTGTPVIASLAGRITRANVSPSYGNIIYIDHAGGLQSRYAHLNRFADGIRNGTQVTAGQLIGYVGTTGRSTGPHLHFEMRVGGEPQDPLKLNYAALTGGNGGGAIVAASSGVASAAVEGLVNQIIRVESGGNASAKNPLSSATGLGQFIESTWLRMMRDYRPDLAQTMNRAALLNLRNDPTLSREMVTNLARENERYLQSKGHSISAGRLYLAHFLGPGGANRVLASAEGNTILAVMGAGVVGANPFLKDYTVADLKAWADRKMRGSGSATRPEPAAPVAPRLTAEMRAYIEIVDEIVEGAG
jgi:murein DD-endopeptidase MepM/ murein hydrolase activator NlpD